MPEVSVELVLELSPPDGLAAGAVAERVTLQYCSNSSRIGDRQVSHGVRPGTTVRKAVEALSVWGMRLRKTIPMKYTPAGSPQENRDGYRGMREGGVRLCQGFRPCVTAAAVAHVSLVVRCRKHNLV